MNGSSGGAIDSLLQANNVREGITATEGGRPMIVRGSALRRRGWARTAGEEFSYWAIWTEKRPRRDRWSFWTLKAANTGRNRPLGGHARA